MTLTAFNIDNSDKYAERNNRDDNHNMDVITQQGRDNLIKKISLLQKQKPEISERISEARLQGGLDENEELHMALEDMQRIDMEVARLTAMLDNVRILDELPVGPRDKVTPGVTVKLENTETERVVEFTILGEFESDPGNGIISYKSPLGAELLNQSVGDCVELDRPSGYIEYEILEIYVK